MSQIQHGREGNEPPADPLSPIAFPDDFYDAPSRPVEPAARPLSPPPPVEERAEEHEPMVEMERTLDTLLLRPPSPPEEDQPPPTPGRLTTGIHPAALAAAAAGVLILGILIGRWTGARMGDVPSGAAETARLDPALQALTEKIDDLGRHVEARPAPPDLTPLQARLDELARVSETVSALAGKFAVLQTRLDELAKASEPVSALPGKFEALQGRVDESAKGVEGLRARLDGLDKALVAFRDEWKATSQPSLRRAVDLFKAGQYAAARDVFAHLRASQPDDARLWYYSALATGFATGKWDGETERLVLQGVARERAGTPSSSEIDGSFADLTANGGKSWLDFYRRRAPGT